jgi:hypothetical protein
MINSISSFLSLSLSLFIKSESESLVKCGVFFSASKIVSQARLCDGNSPREYLPVFMLWLDLKDSSSGVGYFSSWKN